MKRKITFVFEIVLSFIVGIFAFYGMLCFIKTIAESGKPEEMPPSISYTKYNTNNDIKGDFLVITGNGKVLKELIDRFEDVEVIYVCESISAVEPDAFRDVENLKLLIMAYEVYTDDMELPMQTDLMFIEDNKYMNYYSNPIK